MSVVKSKRGQGKLTVYTRTNELAIYTVTICSNEKHFPKRYRWCITNKIVESALTINNCVAAANSIYIADGDEDAKKLRKQYQIKALAETYALLSMIDMAYRTFGIESSRIEFWARLVKEVQTLLRSWKKSENK